MTFPGTPQELPKAAGHETVGLLLEMSHRYQRPAGTGDGGTFTEKSRRHPIPERSTDGGTFKKKSHRVRRGRGGGTLL